MRIQKIHHKLDSENVTATRVNFSIKHFTLNTKETVNDIGQRSQLLVLAFEKVTLPTVETKAEPAEKRTWKPEDEKKEEGGGGAGAGREDLETKAMHLTKRAS